MDGIVVGRLDVGEQDRIIRLLTAHLGLVSAWASRARAPRSPYTTLDLGVRADVGLRARSRADGGDLYTLTGVAVTEARVGIRGQLERLGAAAVACEVAGGLATSQADPRLFGCLETALLLLDQHPEPPGDGFVAGLLAKLLTFAGLAPALERCPACGVPPSAPMAWHPSGGGAYHVDHLPPDVAGSPRVDIDALAQLATLRRRPLLDAYLLPGEVGRMLSLAEAHLGHPLRARAWLRG